MNKTSLHGQEPAQFIVVPLTGVQICRGHILRHLGDEQIKKIWSAAKLLAEHPKIRNPLLPLIRKHITCDQFPPIGELAPEDCTPWIACSPTEAVFFRLRRLGSEYAVDLVVDTQNGIGRQPVNSLRCLVEAGNALLLSRRAYHIATLVVERNDEPKNEKGSLILDFGNTATSAIFAQPGAVPLSIRPVFFHNPFDPWEFNEGVRPAKEKCILKSTSLVLRVPETKLGSPWMVLGKRAEELIRQEPLATSLFAPKKYIREWPEHQLAQAPTTDYIGVMGLLHGLYPKLHFAEWSVAQMLELVQSTLVNPNFGFKPPTLYPQVTEVLLTYPLTWRNVDRELFRRMVRKIAEQVFVLEPAVRDNFRVELICSEPVAVATYVLWEVLFRLFQMAPANLSAPSLASSMLGNVEGSQELRLLIVDIGGGSSDIALLEARWEIGTDDAGPHAVVKTKVLESLRFNRAGDRISHIMAAAILEFFRQKYDITEPLDFSIPSVKQAFTISIKREIISRIMELVESAKKELASNKVWHLEKQDEESLVELFRSVIPADGTAKKEGPPQRLEISGDVLRAWITKDFGSDKTHAEPGFMDIFLYLKELRQSLEDDKLPHLVLLSGRTTRLPFIKPMTAQAVSLPLHRVRTLGEMLPESLQSQEHENMDKLAVVYGAHRLRFGEPIRFVPLPEDPVFKRFLGTVTATHGGLQMSAVLIQRGQKQPVTKTVRVPPSSTLQLGHSFREKGARAQLVASLSNNTNQPRDVKINFIDDYTLVMERSRDSDGVILTECVPGGTSLIVDNFNDTGQIDCEVHGFLRDIVCQNKDQWIKPQD